MFIEIFVAINVFSLLGGLVALLFVEEFNSHKRKLAKDKSIQDLCGLVYDLQLQVDSLTSSISYFGHELKASKTLSFTDKMFTELEEKYLKDKGVF